MGQLKREQILAKGIPSELVECPEWAVNGDQQVRVRALTVADWVAIVDKHDGDMQHAFKDHAAIVAAAAIDEEGKRLFHRGIADADLVGDRELAPVLRMWQVIMRLSRLDKTAEELEKN